MSIAATIDLLQALNATIDGVGSAPLLAAYPNTLGREAMSTAGLSFPLVLTFPFDGEVRGTPAMKRVRYDTLDVLVMVGKTAEETITTNLASLAALIRAFEDAYTDPDNLLLSSTTSILGGEGDLTHTGWSELVYAGTAARGFIFRVRVKEQS